MTNESKYSPAPWEAFAKLTASENHKGFDVQDSTQHWIATVGPRDMDGIEGDANANLIAAAPELLEALAGMLVSDNDTARESDSRWAAFRRYAHAAIAKARGAS